jgi:nitrate reductase gamma subunit
MAALVLVPYAAVAVFVAAVVIRWVKLARMPVHLRWEIYPVAHEENAAYGGSFFEYLDWWKVRRKTRPLGDIKVMAPEILLLRGVREHNPSLWLRSFPFHGGLYLLVGFIGLLVASALAEAGGARVSTDAGGLSYALSISTTLIGITGFVLMGVGALGLLLRRVADPALRTHSSAADFANLAVFIVTAIVGLLAFGVADGDASALRGFVRAVLTFAPAPEVPWPVAAEIIVGSMVLAYIPLTHMSHFFTKWFMYHDVRWNDEVNRVGSKLEARINRQLAYRVDWNAAHIQGAGKKTWADIATEEVPKP